MSPLPPLPPSVVQPRYGSDYQSLTLVPTAADPVPKVILWAPTCSTCGRPQPLTGCLLTESAPPVSGAAGACCWSTSPGQPITADAAARASVDFGDGVLPGVLPITILRNCPCTPPGKPPLLPPYDVTQLAPRPRKRDGWRGWGPDPLVHRRPRPSPLPLPPP